jgi:hypothetical protein
MNMTTRRGSVWSDGTTTIGRHPEHGRATDDGCMEMNGYE